MQHIRAQIREVAALSAGKQTALPAAWISCPPAVRPAPGRYLLAAAAEEDAEPLAAALFAAGYSPDGFLAAPPLPPGWLPGAEIWLHGPFGHGFSLPAATHRLALAAPAAPLRLLALLPEALAAGMDVALFCDDPPDRLPASVEVSPIGGLAEGLHWADFLAVEVAHSGLESLFAWIDHEPLCPAQVLVTGPMPCGGLAGCGVCAVAGRSGPLLACESGPVFPLAKLWR